MRRERLGPWEDSDSVTIAECAMSLCLTERSSKQSCHESYRCVATDERLQLEVGMKLYAGEWVMREGR